MELNLYTIPMYSALVPIVFGVIQIGKIRNYLLPLFILVLCSFTSDMLTYYVKATRGYTWTVYTIIEFILLSAIYYHEMNLNLIRKIIRYSIPVYIVYAILYIFFFKDFDLFLPDLILVSTFYFIIIAVYTFISLIEIRNSNNLFSYPFFWINTALFMYFSGTMFITVAYNIVSMYEVWQLWPYFHNTLNMSKNLIFAYAFFVNYQKINKT